MTLRIPHLYNFNEWNGCDSISQLGSSIKKYSNVMLIGNGFDIALKKNTRYQDFLLYIFILSLFIKLKKLKPQEYQLIFFKVKKFFESQKKDFYCDILDTVYQRVIECDLSFGFLKKDSNFFFNLLLVIVFQVRLDEVFKRFKINFLNLYSFNFISIFSFWMPCFTSSQEVSSFDFAKLSFDAINHFSSDLNIELENNNIYGWMDIEKLIEYIVLNNNFGEDQFLSSSRLKYIFQEEIKFRGIYNNIELSNIVYKSLSDFTDEFSYFVTNQQSLKCSSYSNFSRFNSVTNFYDVDVNCNSSFTDDEYDELCFKNFVSHVIDFNYTDTSEHIFESSRLSESCIYHVNGRGSNKSAIFGYTNSDQKIVNREAFKLEKRTQRLIKHVLSIDYEGLTSKPFNLFIFGHSCSPADKDVFEPLLTSNNLNIVVVYCYSEQDKLSIYKNLCEILGYKLMDHLTRQTEKLPKRLFWAIRK